jgi:hypothetical protein
MQILSPSRIKTFISCSYLGYAKYFLKTPDTGNDGSSRGSTLHEILELLANPRHKKHYDLIMAKKDGFASFALNRLIKRYAKNHGVADPENMEMIRGFLYTALKNDFYFEGADEVFVERQFEVKEPGYHVLGYLDLVALYHDKKIAVIRDWKSSKAKFSKEEIDYNLQSLIYSFFIKKLYPDYKIICQFYFLKFTSCPIQEKIHTDKELAAIEDYLIYFSSYLDSFDAKVAYSNFAKTDFTKSWLCGGKLGELNKEGREKWRCSMKYPFEYVSIYDKDGKFIKSYRERSKEILDNAEKMGYTVRNETYQGCPAHRNLWS